MALRKTLIKTVDDIADRHISTNGVRINPKRQTILKCKDDGQTVLISGLGTVEEKHELFEKFVKIKTAVEKMYGVDTSQQIRDVKIAHGIDIPYFNIQVTNKGSSLFHVKYKCDVIRKSDSMRFSLTNKASELEWHKLGKQEFEPPMIKSMSIILGLEQGEHILDESITHEFSHGILFLMLVARYGQEFLMYHNRFCSLKQLLKIYRDYNEYVSEPGHDCLNHNNCDYSTQLVILGEGLAEVTVKLMYGSSSVTEKPTIYLHGFERVMRMLSETKNAFSHVVDRVVSLLRPPVGIWIT